MKPNLVRAFLSILIIYILTSGSATVATSRIQYVVKQEAIAFEPRAIPQSVVNVLGEHRVVFLGEYHNVREHELLIGDLAIALHAAGFHQLIIECNQAFDWMLEGYVLGELDDLNSQLDQMFGYSLRHIRAYNDTLPPAEKIHVRAGDINYTAGAYYGSLSQLAQLIPASQAIQSFINSVPPAERDRSQTAVQAFRDQLQSNAGAYRASWGQRRYDQVLAMTRVQLRSFGFQQLWDRDNEGALALREEDLKTNLDEYLAGNETKTLINFGGKHTQRKHFTGVEQEWLGQYLSERSPYAAGETFLLFAVPFEGERLNGGKVQHFDLSSKSTSNELFRSMLAAADGKASFLSMDDPLFTHQLIPVRYWSGLRMQYPKQYFDGYLVLPAAHLAIPPHKSGTVVPMAVSFATMRAAH